MHLQEMQLPAMSLVLGTLYQGGAQRPGPLRSPGTRTPFHLVVLCAREIQPLARDNTYHASAIYHAPLADAPWRPLRDDEVGRIMRASDQVARRLRDQEHVLVTCAAGLNRSGVVSAIALRKTFGFSAERAIELVRAARGPFALSNRQFVKLVESY